ncbi:hypothetical protein K8T06_14825 [bacterium]|nr:hypothetical protein [bacterium]
MMKKIVTISALVFVCISSTIAIDCLEITQRYNLADLKIITEGSYSLLNISGCHFPSKPGRPDLPVQNRTVKIPQGMKVVDIHSITTHWQSVSGKIIPRPHPAPQIISLPIRPVTVIPSADYLSSEAFPGLPVRLVGNSIQNGHQFAVLEITPIRFFPSESRVEMLIDISIELELTRIDEPEPDNDRGPDDYDYLVIGPEDYASALIPFIDWKTIKGVKTQYITTEWIDSNITGNSIQEKIRNTIRIEKNDHSIQYVLLVGDKHGVPIRYAFAFDCQAGNNDLGADLYYADLDGSWDEDGDEIFGEVEDLVDLDSDVYIGRAWAKNIEDVETFVAKVLQYEQAPANDYLEKVAFFADVLWEDPFTDSSIHKDHIDETSFPDQFDPITKLYQTSGNETYEMIINTLNAGGHFLNHDGHANFCFWSIPGAMISTTSIEALTNLDRLWIVHSIGCLSNQFDHTRCIGSSFVTNPNGGAIAYIGNFSYGWGMPGNPGFGVSDLYDSKFWELLFQADEPQLGKVLADTKQYFIPQSQEANVYRWVQYSLNLMGDPELPVWTQEPISMTVDHPARISSETQSISVWVLDDTGAVSGALICLHRADECFSVGTTDSEGFVSLEVPADLTGPPTLTVTKSNHLPYQACITVDGMPDLRIQANTFADGGTSSSIGDEDGHAEPGETIDLMPTLINYGSDPALAVTAILTTNCPEVTIINGTAGFGTIPGGETGALDTPFCLGLSPDCPPNVPIAFTMELSFNSVNQTTRFSLMIDQEALRIKSYVVYDMMPDGDCDGILENGEIAFINIELENTGQSSACHPVLEIFSASAEPWSILIWLLGKVSMALIGCIWP